MTLQPSLAAGVFGQVEVLTATVNSAAGTPTGTVTFLNGTTVLGTAPVDAAGRATLTVALGVGAHALTASFAGGGGFADSISAVVTETVNPAATAVTLVSSVNPTATGRAVNFTATLAVVSPGSGTPTGTVTFWPPTTRTPSTVESTRSARRRLARPWRTGRPRARSPRPFSAAWRASRTTFKASTSIYLLGRPADSAGLNAFASAMHRGATDQQLIAAIAGSDEYFANL
jgi:hypothetical protein